MAERVVDLLKTGEKAVGIDEQKGDRLADESGRLEQRGRCIAKATAIEQSGERVVRGKIGIPLGVGTDQLRTSQEFPFLRFQNQALDADHVERLEHRRRPTVEDVLEVPILLADARIRPGGDRLGVSDIVLNLTIERELSEVALLDLPARPARRIDLRVAGRERLV